MHQTQEFQPLTLVFQFDPFHAVESGLHIHQPDFGIKAVGEGLCGGNGTKQRDPQFRIVIGHGFRHTGGTMATQYDGQQQGRCLAV